MEKEMKIYKLEITLSGKLEYFIKASSKEMAEDFVTCNLFGDTDKNRDIVIMLNEDSQIDADVKETNLKDEDINLEDAYVEGIDFNCDDDYEED